MNNNPVFNIFGEPVEILITSKATNYSFCSGVQTSPPGGGPPGPMCGRGSTWPENNSHSPMPMLLIALMASSSDIVRRFNRSV